MINFEDTQDFNQKKPGVQLDLSYRHISLANSTRRRRQLAIAGVSHSHSASAAAEPAAPHTWSSLRAPVPRRITTTPARMTARGGRVPMQCVRAGWWRRPRAFPISSVRVWRLQGGDASVMVKAPSLGLLVATMCCIASCASAPAPIDYHHHHQQQQQQHQELLIDDGAEFARAERSASSMARKIQFFIKNYHLQILPDGTVNGTLDDGSVYSKLNIFCYAAKLCTDLPRKSAYYAGLVFRAVLSSARITQSLHGLLFSRTTSVQIISALVNFHKKTKIVIFHQ